MKQPVIYGSGGWVYTIAVTSPVNSAITVSGGTEVITGIGTGSDYAFSVHKKNTTYTISVEMDGVAKTATVTTGTSAGAMSFVTIEFGTINLTYDVGFRGHVITCTDGTTTVTKTAPSSGSTMTFYPPNTGTWSISGESNGVTYYTTAVVTSLSTAVSATLNGYSEDLTVTYPSGATCTITDGTAETYTAENNPQTFTLHQASTSYTLTVTLEGVAKSQTITTGSSGTAQSVTVEFGTINVTLDSLFVGETVTCTNGTVTMTKVSSSTSLTFRPPYTGIWAVSTVYSGDTYTKQATVSSLSTAVSVTLERYSENVTVTYPSGATCSITDGISESYIATTNPQTFTLHQENTTYTISVTLEGQTKTQTVTTGSSGTAQSVTVEFGTINVTVANEFLNATVTCTGNGVTMTKTATTSSLTFRPPTTGTWTVSSVYSGQTYSAQVNVSSLSTPVSVTLQLKTPMYPFETATDAQLFAMIDAYYDGEYDATDIATLKSMYLRIGAKRTIHLAHMDATGVSESHFDSNGADYEFVIIGHEHDDLQTAINGKTKALLTLQQDRILYTNTTDSTYSSSNRNANYGFGYMNSTNTNAGGWTSCARRTWCNDIYYNALPANIKSKVKTVKKLTSAGSQSSTINTDNDKAFLLSEIEIFGTTNYSFTGEGAQYSYFAAATSNRYKKPSEDTYSSAYWWERSPYSSISNHFCYVKRNGNASYIDASSLYGLAPAFCL